MVSNGDINRYKAKLVPKEFTQKESIDYHDTFSLVSKKDSFWVIMTLVAHFDLELHQMDVKTDFLNETLEKKVYMKQPKASHSNKGDTFVCKFKKSIYRLK